VKLNDAYWAILSVAMPYAEAQVFIADATHDKINRSNLYLMKIQCCKKGQYYKVVRRFTEDEINEIINEDYWSEERMRMIKKHTSSIRKCCKKGKLYK